MVEQTGHSRPFVTVFSLLLLSLAACAPHRPAPVESREPQRKAVEVRKDHYRVRNGDTLYSIAWRYGLDFRHLAGWNHIPPPYRIYPGQQLRLTSPPTVTARPKPAGQKPAVPKTVPSRSGSRPEVAKPKPVKSPPPRKTTKPVQAGTRRFGWYWPTSGSVVQKFRKADRTRQGIRIAGRDGQPVVAAESGKVVYSGSGLVGYGKLIIIKHNKNYLSAYGFNRKLLVQEGDAVTRGERVAEMGRSAEGKAMLHFEIRRQGSAVDPLQLLPRR